VKLVVAPQAKREIRDAAAWYESQARGLSNEFLRAIAQKFGQIERNPKLFAEVHTDIRRAGLRRFPYNLFYRVEDARITVEACQHQHRDPQSWPEH
jgi:plasmid stabilization system protein ParE